MKSFSNAKFITTEFEPFFGKKNMPWSGKKPALYQHTDLIDWIGLPMFLKDFNIVEKATFILNVTALGCVDIYINGNKIGVGDELKPGWTDYLKRTLYYTYDVSDYIKVGDNRILLVASNGWYSGRIAGGRFGDNPPAVMAEILCENNNILSTDTSWLCKVGGQIRTADIWDGEYRDATLPDYTEISLTDFILEEWTQAQAFDYNGEVTEFIGSKVTTRPELTVSPKSIKAFDGIDYNGSNYGKIHICNNDCILPVKMLKGQKLIVDLEQEIVGHLKFTVKGAKGTTIKLRYAEFLNDSGDISRGNDGPEGSVYTINLRSALGKSYYVLSGNGEETYSPTFTFFGFRYVEISADNEVEFINLEGIVVGNNNTEIGKIETSHKLVNKLISNALWGQRGNYLTVPTDCPQRDERLGWTGDAQAFSVTAAYNADVYGFFRKWMQDMRDSQSDEGGYADVNPRVGCCQSEDACAWADAGIIIPYNMYMMYGDDTILKEHFASMEKYIAHILKEFGFAGPIPRYGDWLAYDWCDNKFMSCAYFIHDLDLMAFMSEAINKKDSAIYYKNLRQDALKYFNEHFMENGKLIGTFQSEKVMCLAFNLVDEAYATIIADELEKQIAENGNRLSTGFLGTYNLCPALSRYGKDKTAYNLLMQRNEPSWLYSIDQGATTIWERWNSYTIDKGFGDVGMNSFNHYAYGAIVEWMYAYMAGIKPIEPGFKKTELSPAVDLRTKAEIPEGQEKMTYVKASHITPYGIISSEWENADKFTYNCTVPDGIDCTLVLPAIRNTMILDDKEYEAVDGKFTVILSAGNHKATI